MQPRPRSVLASGLLLFALTCALDSTAASAFTVSDPVVHGNLAVYPVEGGGPGGGSLLTLDQAMRQGAVKIHEIDDRPIEIENLSGHGIFVQAGTMLKGGLQDQVVTTTTIVPPRSGRVPLGTYCVDPYRSTARSGEDAKLFGSNGALLPWAAAKLSLATPVPWSKPASRLRQTGVWWSIDTLRSRLEQRLGEAMEPAHIPAWRRDDSAERRALVQLAARRSSWITSLPLALENRRLAQAQQPYVDAVKRVGRHRAVIGAIFVLNGRFYGADIYASNGLFRRMWPALARAYATEAIAMDGEMAQSLPSAAAAKAFIDAALADTSGRQLAREVEGTSTIIRDTGAAIFSESSARGGQWVHRNVVAKLDPAAAARTPDALAVRILDTGRVGDLALESLADAESVVLHRGGAQEEWMADVPGHASAPPRSVQVDRVADLLAAADSSRSDRGFAPTMLVPLMFVLVLLLAAAILARARSRRADLDLAPAQAQRASASTAAVPSAPDAARLRDTARRFHPFRRRRHASHPRSVRPARPLAA
jgi:hypothetical protein